MALFTMTANGFKLNSRLEFETVVYRNATNKDTMFIDICKAKLNVFRGATAFTKALMSAKLLP
jgi:hypothetical protein